MSIEAIMPSAPVSAPAAQTTSANAPSKPGLFAAVLGEEQAAVAGADAKATGDAEPQGEGESDAADTDTDTAAAVQVAALVAAAAPTTAPGAVVVASAVDEGPTLALDAAKGSSTAGVPSVAPETVAASPETVLPAPATPTQAVAAAVGQAPSATPEALAPVTQTVPVAGEVPATETPAAPVAAKAAVEQSAKVQAPQPSVQPAAADVQLDSVEAPAAVQATAPVQQAVAVAESVPLQTMPAPETDKSAAPASAKAKPAVAPAGAGTATAESATGAPISPDAVQAATEPGKPEGAHKFQVPFGRIVAAEASDRSPKAAPAADSAPSGSTPVGVAPGARAEAGRVPGVEVAQAAGNAPAALAETPGDVAIRSIRYMAAQGEKQLTVRLHPESLGELVIEVTTNGDGLDVRVTASRPAVRQVLETQLGGLRESLAREGVTVTQVTVTADPSGQSFQQAGGRHAGGETGPQRPFPAQANGPYRSNPISAAAAAPRASRHAGALDLYA